MNCFVQHNSLRQVVASQISSCAEWTDWHLSSIEQLHNARHWFLSLATISSIVCIEFSLFFFGGCVMQCRRHQIAE